MVVQKVPRGKVATYGQIAALVFSPRAARMAGFALKTLPPNSKIPWQRVVNREGMISIENLAVSKAEQAKRLQKEGVRVEFRNGNYWVDLEKYLWKPRVKHGASSEGFRYIGP